MLSSREDLWDTNKPSITPALIIQLLLIVVVIPFLPRLPNPSYEWIWTMGEIVTSFCEAGLRIELLHEFPQDFYSDYTSDDVSNDKVEL